MIRRYAEYRILYRTALLLEVCTNFMGTMPSSGVTVCLSVCVLCVFVFVSLSVYVLCLCACFCRSLFVSDCV